MDFLNVKEDLFPIEDLEKFAFSEADDFLTTIQISIAERGQTAIGYAMAFPNVAMREPCARMDLVTNTLDPLARNLYTGQGAINLTKEEGWHWFKLQRPEIEKLYSD
ncbi:unnamed protein product [Notodromas monacha]|nr:unnamed protein product [Notodromas monacha]CAG0924066.1 unnamed protein product [Notodromas monacha]